MTIFVFPNLCRERFSTKQLCKFYLLHNLNIQINGGENNMKNRSREYYREQRRKKIERKKRIIKGYLSDGVLKSIDSKDFMRAPNDVIGYCSYPYWYEKYDGKLSKGKIHCSCPMCAFHETPMNDKRKLLRMKDQIEDLAFYEEYGIDDDQLYYGYDDFIDEGGGGDNSKTYPLNLKTEINKINRTVNKHGGGFGHYSGGIPLKTTEKNPEKGFNEFKFEELLNYFIRGNNFNPKLGFLKNNHIPEQVSDEWKRIISKKYNDTLAKDDNYNAIACSLLYRYIENNDPVDSKQYYSYSKFKNQSHFLVA